MASVEDRIAALENEVAALKQQLAAAQKPRAWLDDIAGSMDPWPEFAEVARLGQEWRKKVNEDSLREIDGE
jgi:hypothetical protein